MNLHSRWYCSPPLNTCEYNLARYERCQCRIRLCFVHLQHFAIALAVFAICLRDFKSDSPPVAVRFCLLKLQLVRGLSGSPAGSLSACGVGLAVLGIRAAAAARRSMIFAASALFLGGGLDPAYFRPRNLSTRMRQPAAEITDGSPP